MSKELFSNVSNGPEYGVGAKKRYAVPISIAIHALAFSIFIFVSLMAVSGVPSVRTMTTFAIAMPAPPPPAVHLISQPPNPRTVNSNSVPWTAPDVINPEPSEQPPSVPGPINRFSKIDGPFIPHGNGEVIIQLPPPPPPSEPQPVGGNIKSPVKIKEFLPVYPDIARFAKIQGRVVLEVIIGVDGKVHDPKILVSIPLLDQAAIDAVRRWEYRPTQLNGRAIPVILKVTMNFTLH